MRVLEDQPPIVEIKIMPGLFVKQMLLARAGTYVPQHSHATGHLSMLAVGSVHAWKGDQFMGTYHAPTGIPIEAGIKHTFRSLVDNTLIYCIHRVGPSGDPEVLEEHEFEGSAG
jgi:hypothetical protein